MIRLQLDKKSSDQMSSMKCFSTSADVTNNKNGKYNKSCGIQNLIGKSKSQNLSQTAVNFKLIKKISSWLDWKRKSRGFTAASH